MARVFPPKAPQATPNPIESQLLHLLRALPDNFPVFHGDRLCRRDPDCKFIDG